MSGYWNTSYSVSPLHTPDPLYALCPQQRLLADLETITFNNDRYTQ